MIFWLRILGQGILNFEYLVRIVYKISLKTSGPPLKWEGYQSFCVNRILIARRQRKKMSPRLLGGKTELDLSGEIVRKRK